MRERHTTGKVPGRRCFGGVEKAHCEKSTTKCYNLFQAPVQKTLHRSSPNPFGNNFHICLGAIAEYPYLPEIFYINMLTVFLIRHAESIGNINFHLIGGQSNHFPLSEQGEVQAHLLGERLAREGHRFDAIYSSTAVRTQATAKIACSYLSEVPPLALRPELLELSQGEWEGKVRKDIYTPECLALVRSDAYDFRPPQGESQRDVEFRMYQWLSELKTRYGEATSPVSVAAFSHGFAIKSLLRGIFHFSPNMTYRTMIHNTSITGLYLQGGVWYVERVNDFQHIVGTPFIDHY